jgi:Excisionase from transposon Tn916.
LKQNNRISEKALLSVSEFCEYVGIGKTKAREILNDPCCDFSFRIGNRIYANKKKLDDRLAIRTGLI